MSEIEKFFKCVSGVHPPETEQINAHNSVIFSSIEDWDPDRWGLGAFGISVCGEFSQSVIDAHKSYQESPGEISAITSPGFGYSADDLAALKSAGFYTGPVMGLVFENRGQVWDKPDSQNQALDQHKSQRYLEGFKSLGIKTCRVTGGYFPGERKDVAIILDINDPEFLKKIKPAFLGSFPNTRAKQAHVAFQNDFRTRELQIYCIQQKLLALRAVIFEGMFEAVGDDHSPSLLKSDYTPPENLAAEVSEWIDRQMGFASPGVRIMNPVLTQAEKEELIIKTAELMIGTKAQQPNPAVLELLQR